MTTALEPLPVTVVIPAFNRPELTAAAVKSALGQKPRPPAEVLVVDDYSSDDTAGVAEAAGARVIRHEQNLGRSQARNTGIRAALQKWVATLDSDDQWFEHHLDALWPYTDAAIMVTGSALACGEDPTNDRVWGIGGRTPLRLDGPADLLPHLNFVVMSGVLVRRDVVVEVGGFNPDIGHNEDVDLWLRVLEHGPALVLPAVTVRYAVHPDQASDDRPAVRSAYREVATSYSDRGWWSQSLYERLDGALRWDEFREALAARSAGDALAAAADLLSRPQRLVGTVSLLRRRLGERRATTRVTRSGEPSVRVAADARDLQDWALNRFGTVPTVSAERPLQEAWALISHPPGRLVTRSAALRAVARTTGVEVVSP